MKIISKNKDYYDYVQGIYGIDEKLVLDRRSNSPFLRKEDKLRSITESIKEVAFHIAGRRYQISYYMGKPYYTLSERKALYRHVRAVENPKRIYMFEPYFSTELYDKQNSISDENIKHRVPILIKEYNSITTNFLLGDFGFAKIIPAETMFTNISLFLGYLVDHPAIKNNQTNMEKLLSHGFDKKKSFRHRK